ncbi:MAG: hypothetical protein RIR37_407, partial [Verrucomicrobiota bacterium]
LVLFTIGHAAFHSCRVSLTETPCLVGDPFLHREDMFFSRLAWFFQKMFLIDGIQSCFAVFQHADPAKVGGDDEFFHEIENDATDYGPFSNFDHIATLRIEKSLRHLQDARK